MRVGMALLMAASLLLTGCSDWKNRNESYQYFEMIQDGEWSSGDELFFSTSELKPNRPYNVKLVLRLDRDIKYRSIPLGITFETPHRVLKTHEVIIPVQSHHSGQGGFNIHEQETILQEGVQYPDPGVYTYSIRHLSTDTIISGVVEVGLLIEPK